MMYKRQSGFTLIEIMITVAILAILTTIALPAYQDQIRTSKRTEGQNLLLEAASRQQRYFSDNMSYANQMTVLGYASNTEATATGAYSVSTTGNANSFTLTATATTSQAGDGCANLTMTHTGVKGRSGSRPLSECWK